MELKAGRATKAKWNEMSPVSTLYKGRHWEELCFVLENFMFCCQAVNFNSYLLLFFQ